MVKRFGLCAAALILASIGTATQAHAAPFRFYSTGTFGSTGTSSLVLGSGATAVTLSFSGAGTVVTPIGLSTPTFVTFGTILATGGSTSTFAKPVAGETFTLSIFQTLPGAGAASFVGAVSGKIKRTASQLFIDFSAPFSATISGITYTLLEADEGHLGRTLILPPDGGRGQTSIEGQVTGNPRASVPEPVSAFLLGVGFLGSAAAARRRRKAQA